ncbi:uncharacterized protein LOC143803905 [Ranitomeya variabilis]|uniref:uncharacterized protein LOC143803905 n=1 Tax=Ranitomeya variabilis TaxID=490064 RepID=UPI0040567856
MMLLLLYIFGTVFLLFSQNLEQHPRTWIWSGPSSNSHRPVPAIHPSAKQQVGLQHGLETRKLVHQVFPCPSPVPIFWGSFRQRQKASDRSLMPEFLHLSLVFQNGLKALGDRLESDLTHINTLLQDDNKCLNHLKADLQRPAHHFFNQIEQGMSEHLTPDLQLNVMQACNAAYHCTATTIPSPAGHHYSAPTMPSTAAQSTATTMPSGATRSKRTLLGRPPAPCHSSSTSTRILPGRPPTPYRSSSNRILPGCPPAPCHSSSNQIMPGCPPAQSRLKTQHQHSPEDSSAKHWGGRKKNSSLSLPPLSPQNVSVMSGLPLPSSVSVPSHASNTIPDLTTFVAPSPATPLSSLPKHLSSTHPSSVLFPQVAVVNVIFFYFL